VLGRLSTLLVVALTGALLAGCGSTSKSIASSSQTTPTAPSAGQTTPAAAASSPAMQQAIAACKRGIEDQPATVRQSAKTSLEGICAKDARRGPAALARGSRNLCLDAIANAEPTPAGPTLRHMILICKKYNR
jgi:hypothetical protein